MGSTERERKRAFVGKQRERICWEEKTEGKRHRAAANHSYGWQKQGEGKERASEGRKKRGCKRMKGPGTNEA